MPATTTELPASVIGSGIVEADACVGIDGAKRRGLGFQMLDNEREDRVLQHVREIASVMGVAIVHGTCIRAPGAVVSRRAR